MKTANERFKEIRLACEKTQDEWGKILGISHSGVAEIESGRRNVNMRHIKALESYSEYSINTAYILDGVGDPFYKPTNNQRLLSMFNDVASLPPDDPKKRFFMSLSYLSSDEWELLLNISEKLNSAN